MEEDSRFCIRALGAVSRHHKLFRSSTSPNLSPFRSTILSVIARHLGELPEVDNAYTLRMIVKLVNHYQWTCPAICPTDDDTRRCLP